MMKKYRKASIFAAVFLLLFCITSCVSAFTISSVDVLPGGEQAPGTPLTVNAAIAFPSTGTESFPQDHELQMSTALDSPRWVPVVVLDGVETGMPVISGDSLAVSGYYLSYPPGQEVRLRVILTGILPADVSADRVLLQVRELDAQKNSVETATLDMPATPAPTLPATTQKTLVKITLTPIPTDTPSPASPSGAGWGVIATAGAALLAMRRR